MPHLSCRTCGRRIYSVAKLSTMTADERRCPRCGSPFEDDRRGPERRTGIRRDNPTNDPGPPTQTTAADDAQPEHVADEGAERRHEGRRTTQRRGGRPPLPPTADNDPSGWKD